ncbi:ferritin-like domain-containing protein [Pseudoalteromonas sp. NJ631]|uniref:ferritin-like domain-containing protein n=1 Tax=Pseudoalteromonas sp. NJ631 TaxID=493915 RepID=UPI0002D26211|nr:ferritin-like domain-containing protein [Pseudoalteromonas sp. NJ631]
MNVQNKTGPSVEVDKEIDANILLSSAQKQQIKARNSEYKAADLSCLRAIAQAAINVELFTIPLYMTGLYSIQGTHQIADASNLYPGRYWPGLGPTAGYIPEHRLNKGYDVELKPLFNIDALVGDNDDPNNQKDAFKLSVNQQVFNGVYSVFIEEMLHLQLASNMASKLGLTPSFTSQALIDEKFGWKCYNNQSSIPHILDFADCSDDLSKLSPEVQAYFKQIFPNKTLQDLRVNATELNKEQTLLFMLIEETEENAKKIIQEQYLEPNKDTKRPKYFEQAPYDWWKPDYTEKNLPLFGSIGHMYLSYWDYIQIQYDDGTSLLDYATIQRDYFNERPGNKDYQPQFPGIKGSLNVKEDHTALKEALMNNVNAITDQGEGDGVAEMICKRWADEKWAQNLLAAKVAKADDIHLSTVEEKFQPSAEALKADYPASCGEGPISGSACARITNKYKDHFQIFTDTMKLIVDFEKPSSQSDERYMTWSTWFAEGNNWNEALLDPNGGDEAAKQNPNLPCVSSVVKALNNLKLSSNIGNTHQLFSQSAVGTIKGLTTALDRYWSGKTSEFPGPAMGGSGDRISICWATTGIAPDLVTGIAPQNPNTLYHACQGMSYTNIGSDDLPPPEVYHSCKGSNDCKAQGGCGFVHSTTPGGSCGGSVSTGPKSAPADNKCNNLGGCAVPISASQLFPKLSGEDQEYDMQLFKFNLKDNSFSAIDYTYPKGQQAPTDQSADHVLMPYKQGDAVYNIAWQAYCNANGLLNEDGEPKEKPKPSDIRLALPPST